LLLLFAFNISTDRQFEMLQGETIFSIFILNYSLIIETAFYDRKLKECSGGVSAGASVQINMAAS
jgi:hypothetical protein